MTTMPRQKPHRSSSDYETPPELVAAVKRLLGVYVFNVDLAADQDTSKGQAFYSLESDSLSQNWNSWGSNGWCWLNPPFNNITPWAKKCAESPRAHIAFLIPAAVGSNWYRHYVEPYAAVRALNGRPSFDGKGPYPKDVLLCLYGPGFLPSFKTWDWRAQP